MQPMDGHFYTKDEETHWVLSFVFKLPDHFHFGFLVVVVVAVVNDVTVDIVVGVAVVVVFVFLVFFLTSMAGPVLHCPSLATWLFPSSSKHTHQNSILCVLQPVANLSTGLLHLVCSFPSLCTSVWAVPSRRGGTFRLSALVRSCQEETEECL